MEFWILTVFAMESKLGYIADKYTKRAEDAALHPVGDTFAAIERVAEINDMKRRIVNMKVICDKIKEVLKEDDLELLTAYASSSAAEIAGRENISRAKVYRRIARAMRQAVRALSRLGYDKAKMDGDYLSLQLPFRIYSQIKRLKRKERESEEKAVTCLGYVPPLDVAPSFTSL